MKVFQDATFQNYFFGSFFPASDGFPLRPTKFNSNLRPTRAFA
jgi:hypothetical protein